MKQVVILVTKSNCTGTVFLKTKKKSLEKYVITTEHPDTV
jgi:hypothetical protein